MKRLVSYSCLVWLVCVSAAASEQADQADQHHETSMVTKGLNAKSIEIEGEENEDFASPDLKVRKQDWDSVFESDSNEESGMQDRGLFDGGLFGGGYGRNRRHGGRFSPTLFGGGYGGGRGRGHGRGRAPYGRQFNQDPGFGAGYPNSGFGGQYASAGFPMQQYPSRFSPYSGGRGGGQFGRFPGAGAGSYGPGAGAYGASAGSYGAGAGFYGSQQSYRQPYYRNLQPESSIPVEPAVAR